MAKTRHRILVTCKDNTGYEQFITKGKKYPVVGFTMNTPLIRVITDQEWIITFHGNRFGLTYLPTLKRSCSYVLNGNYCMIHNSSPRYPNGDITGCCLKVEEYRKHKFDSRVGFV